MVRLPVRGLAVFTDRFGLVFGTSKHLYQFLIRWYTGKPSYGRRQLGVGRIAYDFGRVTFVFERYNVCC